MIKGFVIERPAKVHVNQNNIAPIIFKDYIFCKHYAVVIINAFYTPIFVWWTTKSF